MGLHWNKANHRGLQGALLTSAFWLVMLTGINILIEDDISHILAYAVPVGWVAWYSLKLGFVVAAGATLSAVIGGAIPSHPELGEPLYVEGFYAYGKLTMVALGTRMGRRMARRKTARMHERDDI